jgi:hypothetical protein
LYALGACLAASIPLVCSCRRPAAPAPPSKVPEAVAPPPKPRFPKPDKVRGIYLTAWSAGSKKKMEHMFAYLKRNGLNTVVIDVRDCGDIYFKTDIPLAKACHATNLAVVHPDRLLDSLQAHGIYPIARIACFRDKHLPFLEKGRAVQFPDGSLWTDRAGYTWLDPYNKKNWDYIGSVVDYALNLGFPEVQLDYVRFPSEGKESTMVFPSRKTYPDKKATPTQVVAAFATAIAQRVKAKNAAYSADIFGIVSSTTTDEGIGQELETVAAPFDRLSPMVYPSHFHKGEYGIADPNQSPYRIIVKSLRDYRKRLPGKPIRPWLQDFWGYSATQVNLQIKAAKDVGFDEFLLWNSGNQYSEGVKAGG